MVANNELVSSILTLTPFIHGMPEMKYAYPALRAIFLFSLHFDPKIQPEFWCFPPLYTTFQAVFWPFPSTWIFKLKIFAMSL